MMIKRQSWDHLIGFFHEKVENEDYIVLTLTDNNNEYRLLTPKPSVMGVLGFC